MIVGINGFGRIGRNAARVILNTQGATLGAINSMSSFESHAYLLAHDSTQGAFDKKLDGVKIVNEKEPEKIPWGEVDVVLECTGKFRTTDEASKHSVKKIVISAPAKDDNQTIYATPNVNIEALKNGPISCNASCTTNATTPIAPVRRIVLRQFSKCSTMTLALFGAT